jgi:3-(3-hydroxy-phenyl)propionate hydroxylase
VESAGQIGPLSLEQVQALIAPVAGPTGSLPEAVDVLVVGAGPIGLTAANLLGSLDISTLLVEQNEFTADLPRAVSVDDEYMRLLNHLGLESELTGHVSPPFGIHFYSSFGRPVVKVPPFVTPNGFGKRSGVAQPVLEKLLAKAAQRFPHVKLRYRSRIVDLTQDSDGVTCSIVDASDVTRTVRAKFVLACDGARSFVRNHLRIPFVGSRIDEPHLVIDFAAFPDQSPYSRFFCNPRRPFNSIPTPYGGRRIEFMLMPGDNRDEMTSEEQINDLIDNDTPYRGVRAGIVRKTVYGYSERMAERFQDGRVFLLGDAAHVMPPFGAQAMNTGARDASNLCWKLARVIHDDCDAAILASYDPERRDQVENIVDYSVRIGKFANLHSRPLALARDAMFSLLCTLPSVNRYFSEMRYMPSPKLSTGLVLENGRGLHLGRIFPRPELIVADKPVNIDQLLGNGFGLVAVDIAKAGVRQLTAAMDLLPQPAKAVHVFSGEEPPGAPGVVTARLARANSLPGCSGSVFVLRPDRYVAAVCRPDELARTLEALQATLMMRRRQQCSEAA